MILQMIGLLLEIKPTETTNKKTNKVTAHTEIQVMFKGIDEKGYTNTTVETIQLDEDDYDRLIDKKDTHVCISYKILNTPSGTYVFPDQDMPVLTLDKNPLDYSQYDRSKIKKDTKQV